MDAIDLGLPSGTLWAAANIGADIPEQFGIYSTWDEAKSCLERGWNLPKKEDYWELCDGCAMEVTEVNGITGLLFTSRKNGNSIFLPAAGYGADLVPYICDTKSGHYWTSTRINDDGAYGFDFYDFDARLSGKFVYKTQRLSLRAVKRTKRK